MGGFGRHPFGRHPFGHSPWAKEVRYDLLPAVYRERDAAEGYPLLQYINGVVGPLERLRGQIRRLPELRDPAVCDTQYSANLPFRLGRQVLRLGVREQSGVDGRVLALREFVAASARFATADRGKFLVVGAAGASPQTVRIALVVSATTVLTEPSLPEDAGPLRWELRAQTGGTDHVVLEVYAGDARAVGVGWVLSDGEAEYEVVGRASFPDRADPHISLIDRYGEDGSIDAFGRFSSPSASSILSEDLGRPLVLQGSALAANNGRFLIGPLAAPGVIALLNSDGTPATLVQDAGPLTWALLPLPQVLLQGTVAPRGTIEQSGRGATIASPGVSVTVVLPGGQFTAGRDEGKVLTLVNTTSTRQALIGSVTSETELEVTSFDGASLPAGSAWVWAARSRTRTDDLDPTRVVLRAPAQLPALAGDFGLQIDRQEREDRQRSWVRHVSAWTALKGSAAGYAAIGRLSGATVTPKSLFRVSQEVFAALPNELAVELSEWAAGRNGSDGVLTPDPGGARLTASSAVFTSGDVGRQIRVRGSVYNDGLRTIAAVVNATTAVFRPEDGATAESGLTWGLVRLYAREPPLMARCDDFNADLMEELLDGLPPQSTDVWSVDRWCWEAGTVESLPVVVLSAMPTTSRRYLVTVSGRADVVSSVGSWKIVDAEGLAFFLESVPESVDPGLPSFSFEIATVFAPSLGAASLTYVCAPALSCDYCASSKVQVDVEFEGGATAGEMERALERLSTRLDEVTPAHVEVVPRSVATLEAVFGGGFGLVASLEVP